MRSRKKIVTSSFVLLFGMVGFMYALDALAADANAHLAVFDIGVSLPTPNTAIVRWATDAPANSRVEYGLHESEFPGGAQWNANSRIEYELDQSYKNSDLDLTQVLNHAVKLTNLKPGSLYFYRVISTDTTTNRTVISQQFVFVSLREISRSETAGISTNPPVLTFTAPRQHEILKDQTVTFTYQIDGNWPLADRVPHIYLWADELRNGTWIERASAFDVGSRTNAALRSGSFMQKFAPGIYRIDGLLAASQPKHEMLQGSSVSPLVFTVWDAGSTEVMAAVSSSLLALPSGSKLKSGDRIRNWRSADVRQTPSKSNSLIGVQAPDTKGTIIGSPEAVADSRWWNINYDVGYDGWTSEDSLLPVNAPVFDFELVGLDDHGASADQGSSADFSFGGRLTSGAGQLVAFSAQGIPGDAYAVFSPASCTLPCLTTLHISTLRTTPVGVYPIMITAISAKKEKKLSFKMQITRFSPVPSVSLTAPFLDGIVPGSNLVLSSMVTGDADISGTRSIHFRLDNSKDRTDAVLNGSHMFANLPTGAHLLTGYLAGNRDVKISGTDFSLAFVSDASLPVVSGVNARNVTDASAAIVWNTDKNSTTRVAYDGVVDLRFLTTEFDTDGRQQTHIVNLQSLIPCTGYWYRAYSKNTTGGEGISQMNRFSTTGCFAPMLSGVHAEGVLSTLAQRTLTLVRDDDRSVSVTLPSGYPDTAAVEINGLDSVGVGSAAPAPTSQSRLIAAHAYRVVVLKDPSTSVFTSDKPVTLSMRYLPEDAKDIVAGSLKIWRWTGVDWTETNQCHTNEDLHEVSCMTDELSTFALFGVSSRLLLAPPPGALMLFVLPKPAPDSKVIDDLLLNTTPVTYVPSVIEKTKTVPVQKKNTATQRFPADARVLTRDLYRGIKHPEVKLLQQFLVLRNYLGAGGNTGFFDGATETAIKKFQCDQSIVCEGTQSTTGFGSVDAQTRDRINALLK